MPAFDKKPSTWLGAGYSVSSHTIIMNTGDASSDKTLPQLTDAQAHATTGDIRNVVFALMEAIYQAWLAQSASLPKQIAISRTANNRPDGTLAYNYSVQIKLAPPAGSYSVVAEP